MPSQSFCNRSFSPYLQPRAGRGRGRLLQPLTFSLCSFLFTITAVICWSMNIKMVQSRAGMTAANTVHQGLRPMGLMNHPRSSLVGCNKAHTLPASSPRPATPLALILPSTPGSEHLPALPSCHPLPWASALPSFQKETMHLEAQEEMVTPPASPPDSALSCPGLAFWHPQGPKPAPCQNTPLP